MYIARQNGEIFIFINENALVSSLEEMPDPFVSSVVIPCIRNVELAHEFGKISERRFDEQVEMVAHEDVRMQFDRIDIEGL